MFGVIKMLTQVQKSILRRKSDEDCFCHTCNAGFNHLGIARHRAMHRDNKENCKITFSKGDTYEYTYDSKINRSK